MIQLIYLNQTSNSADPNYDAWSVVICTQFVQAFSIVAACVPYLKPFFLSLESGMIRSDDLRRRGLTNPYGYSTGDSAQSGAFELLRGPIKRPAKVALANASSLNKHVGQLTRTTSTTLNSQYQPGGSDGKSDTSRFKGIRKTASWTVDSELQRLAP